jgi:hypothetical protein
MSACREQSGFGVYLQVGVSVSTLAHLLAGETRDHEAVVGFLRAKGMERLQGLNMPSDGDRLQVPYDMNEDAQRIIEVYEFISDRRS